MSSNKGPLKVVVGLVTLAVVTTGSGSARAGVSFHGLGFKGDAMNGQATSVFDAVVDATIGLQAFRWSLGGGLVPLPDLPGCTISETQGVSADGSAVVGYSGTGLGGSPAQRWAVRWSDENGDGNWEVNKLGDGDLPGGAEIAHANAASADGSVIVGSSYSGSGLQAWRWTEQTGMVGLDYLPSDYLSGSMDVSSDGSVVVGESQGQDTITLGWRWTESKGMQPLGPIPGWSEDSWPLAASADGTVAVGFSHAESGTEIQAFRWTESEGMMGLGDLPGGDVRAFAMDVSADGAIVIGTSEPSAAEQIAWMWDGANGMRPIQDVFILDYGMDLSGWTLTQMNTVSDDGLVFCGKGVSPSGQIETWIASIPEPATLALVGVCGAFLLRKKGK